MLFQIEQYRHTKFIIREQCNGIFFNSWSNSSCGNLGKWSSNSMMNEIVLEIQELEDAVNKLKLVDAPEAFVAIRTIDVVIERKRSQLEAFERTFDED